jgi:LacI family transcriptional regulator
MKTRVKMKDIAKELGVSTVSVSKALSGKDGVSEKLRKLITQRASDLGYLYNSAPRNLLLGRSCNLGILIPAKYLGESAFYWLFYQRLLLAMKKTNYSGILEIISNEDEANCVIPSYIANNKVDGIILLGQFSETYLTMITQKEECCIFLDFYSDIGKCDCIATNNFLGSYNLTKLLIAAGHQNIAFIGSPCSTTSILDRYLGFCKAMLEAGLSYQAAIEDRDNNSSGYLDFPLNTEEYTAFVCNNDQLAGIVVKRLQQMGLRVPGDISIVGFDNEDETVTGGIGITSLEIDISSMCDLAVDLLVEHIEKPDYRLRGRILIDSRVITKQSIAQRQKVAEREKPEFADTKL